MKTVLHAGAGCRKSSPIPEVFKDWKEIRLDIDSQSEPDILSSIVAMPMVDDESVDVVYTAHTLEHLYIHEAICALREFYRVLKPGGQLLILVPDLQSAAEVLAMDYPDAQMYSTPSAGSISPIDMVYGFQAWVCKGNYFMAHKMGYTCSLLKKKLGLAGFERLDVRRIDGVNISASGFKPGEIKEEYLGFSSLVGEGSPLRRTEHDTAKACASSSEAATNGHGESKAVQELLASERRV